MPQRTFGWRQARAVLLLPVVVTVVVPTCLLLLTEATLPVPAWLAWPVGIALLLAGLALIVSCVRLFARLGRGTLAPWDPPTRLVVAGPYRYVRNPMITGVFAVLLAESLLLDSTAVFWWFAGFVLVNLTYVRLSEEPALRRRFGADYEVYADNVRAWIPRPSPWRPSV